MVSRREYAKGDIFVYDFDQLELTRLTNGTTTPEHALFKDGVSISHDAQWVAFHGSPDKDDPGNYELYKIRTDGTGFTRLTDTPGVLTGHPAWSPDDTEIVYVKFGIPEGADLYVLNAGTGSTIRRLTDTTFVDSHPDWSPDGSRIVFKSTRWTGKEQLALMDADGDAAIWPNGKNVIRLTANEFSDHYGVFTPDGEWIHFSRYIGPGSWLDHFEYHWPPKDPKWCEPNWEMRAVRTDALKEILCADPYSCIRAEWFPREERSKDKGLVFIRAWGMEYSVIFRAQPGGGDPVTLLPEMTYVTHLDWK
jgi:Tol biopolymer transport system component